MFTLRRPPGLRASEEKLQRELNLARNVRLAADHSEIGCSEEHAGHAELHAIGGVEELAAELEFHRTIWMLSGNRHLAKALDITVVPLFAFFIMKNASDSVSELLASAEWHGRVVEAIANRDNARGCMESALRFFNEQERWMLFEGVSKPD